jgi:hypothetical protein
VGLVREKGYIMIVCRVHGKKRAKLIEALEDSVCYLGFEFEEKTIGEEIPGFNPITLFTISSNNKEDIKKLSQMSGIPQIDFLFM